MKKIRTSKTVNYRQWTMFPLGELQQLLREDGYPP